MLLSDINALLLSQKICFGIGYLVVVIWLAISIFMYFIDKHKKVAHLNNNFIFYLIFALLFSALTYAVNMFFGMTVNSIMTYVATLFVPIEIAFTIMLKPIVNSILLKFRVFYK